MFQAANAHFAHPWGDGGQPFEWRFVSAGGGPITASNGMRIETEPFDDSYFDLVVIPGIHYPGFQAFTRQLDQLGETYAWMRVQWSAGAWMGTHCSGVFILAQSGLLDGRAATTAWWLDRQFRSR